MYSLQIISIEILEVSFKTDSTVYLLYSDDCKTLKWELHLPLTLCPWKRGPVTTLVIEKHSAAQLLILYGIKYITVVKFFSAITQGVVIS